MTSITTNDNENFTFDWLGMLKRHYILLEKSLLEFYSNSSLSLDEKEATVASTNNNNDESSTNTSLTQLSSSSLSTSTNSSSSSSSSSFDFKNEFINSVNVYFVKNLTDATPSKFSNCSFGEKHDQTLFIIISLLREKMLELYLEQREPYDIMLDRARFLIANKVDVFDGHDACKERVLNSTQELLSKHTNDYVRFVQNLPGLTDCIDVNDLIALAQDNFCLVFAMKVTNLFIENEFYLSLNDVQLSRKWMESLLGIEIANKVFQFHSIFNKLELTDNEISLLIPILITSPCKKKN